MSCQPTPVSRASRCAVRLSLLCGLMLIVGSHAGCSNFLPELVPFGSVTPPDHFRSLNGLGVHQRMWESTGAKVLTPQKLSPMLDSMDAIVMVGQTFDPPGRKAREWLETWLAAKPGRSVIYFGRDFNAEVYYRRQTLGSFEGQERLRGEQLLGLVEAEELAQVWKKLPENTFCEWFYLETQQPPREFTSFQGGWNTALSDATGAWPTRTQLLPPQMSYKNRQPSWLANPTAKPVQQNPFADLEGNNVTRSIWRLDELDTQEKWDDAFKNLPDSQVLLSGDDGTPLVFRLTDSIRYPGSQIVVIANGAPFLNGSLVQPLHQRVGEKIIETVLPAKRVSLLAYGELGILISTAAEADSRGLGLEMLTTWPLSAITMPASLLGILVCAALWPILGRPRRTRPRSVSDFGLHIDALGRMLLDSRDAEFARKSVAEYFKQVREEAPPTWLAQLASPPVERPVHMDHARQPNDADTPTPSAEPGGSSNRLP
jgi:hypothetical protein